MFVPQAERGAFQFGLPRLTAPSAVICLPAVLWYRIIASLPEPLQTGAVKYKLSVGTEVAMQIPADSIP